MKMKEHDFNHIKDCIEKVIGFYGKDHLIKTYEIGNFSNSNKVKDLQMRFCFDIFHTTSREVAGFREYVNKISYAYLNDDHIYTALKIICPQVTKKY